MISGIDIKQIGAVMIQVYLSKDEYEYDIYSLVKAFYPNVQIKVYKEFLPEQKAEKDIIKGNSLRNIKDQTDSSTPPITNILQIYIDFWILSLR